MEQKRTVSEAVIIGELRARLQFAEERCLLLAAVATDMEAEMKDKEQRHAAELLDVVKSRDSYRDALYQATSLTSKGRAAVYPDDAVDVHDLSGITH